MNRGEEGENGGRDDGDGGIEKRERNVFINEEGARVERGRGRMERQRESPFLHLHLFIHTHKHTSLISSYVYFSLCVFACVFESFRLLCLFLCVCFVFVCVCLFCC